MTACITAYIHCGKCIEEWKTERGAGESPASYARLSVGFTRQGLQVFCARHEVNVVHIDFEGAKHPADTGLDGLFTKEPAKTGERHG